MVTHGAGERKYAARRGSLSAATPSPSSRKIDQYLPYIAAAAKSPASAASNGRRASNERRNHSVVAAHSGSSPCHVELETVEIEERHQREQREPYGALFAVEKPRRHAPGDPQRKGDVNHSQQVVGPIGGGEHAEPGAHHEHRQRRMLGIAERELPPERELLATYRRGYPGWLWRWRRRTFQSATLTEETATTVRSRRAGSASASSSRSTRTKPRRPPSVMATLQTPVGPYPGGSLWHDV